VLFDKDHIAMSMNISKDLNTVSSDPNQMDNLGKDFSEESDRITLTEARKILRVSPNKMSKLVSDGTLSHEQDPLDQRVKLVKRKDVENLRLHSRRG
jgi:hypothetical protein